VTVTACPPERSLGPWLYIGTFICCSNSHKHLACTAQRRRQKQIPRPHHHPFLRKHPSSHRPLSPIADHRSKPRLIFTENPQPGTNLTTSHRARSPPSGVTAALQLVKVLLPSQPARTFKVPTDRHPNTPSNHAAVSSQNRSHSRTCHQPNSPRGESPGRNRGHRIGLLLLLGAILAPSL